MACPDTWFQEGPQVPLAGRPWQCLAGSAPFRIERYKLAMAPTAVAKKLFRNAGQSDLCSRYVLLPMCPGRTEEKWSRGWELNPRPADYESAALPLSYLGVLDTIVASRAKTCPRAGFCWVSQRSSVCPPRWAPLRWLLSCSQTKPGISARWGTAPRQSG
jgi:hypothetical protein